jgi:hypothetical protein
MEGKKLKIRKINTIQLAPDLLNRRTIIPYENTKYLRHKLTNQNQPIIFGNHSLSEHYAKHSTADQRFESSPAESHC